MAQLVSVLMPSFNQRRFIAAAVESVLAQGHPQVELVVADGGSSDGTVEWLAERSRFEPRLRWEAAPDSGPAQAVNRAMARARGTVIGWLNSDDVYAAGAIERAVDALLQSPEWLMVYGHGMHIDATGAVIGAYPTRTPAAAIGAFAEGCFICQPTVFFRRTMPLLVGPLDESLQTAFDFDWWLRAFARVPGRIGFVDAVQAHSRLHPDTLTSTRRRTVAVEGMKVLARHLGSAPRHWIETWANEDAAARPDIPEAQRRQDWHDVVEETRDWMSAADLAACRARCGRANAGGKA
jgi:glycosyltransferase involved in cell wall biosynthesis